MTISETIPNTGVDATKQWMMVPTGGYTWFTLHEAEHLTVRVKRGPVKVFKFREARPREREMALSTTWDALAKVRLSLFPEVIHTHILQADTKKNAVYFIKAHGMGGAVLAVSRGRKPEGTIEVSIHRRRRLSVALNLVKHKPNGGGAVSHGRLSLVDLRNMAHVANGVLTPQTNVVIEPIEKDLIYNGDLGKYLEYYSYPSDPSELKEYNALVNQANKKVVNVYSVYGYHNPDRVAVTRITITGATHTVHTHPGHVILCSGGTKLAKVRLGVVLAHELCHAVVRGTSDNDVTGSTRGLMNARALESGPIMHEDLKMPWDLMHAFHGDAALPFPRRK